MRWLRYPAEAVSRYPLGVETARVMSHRKPPTYFRRGFMSTLGAVTALIVISAAMTVLSVILWFTLAVLGVALFI